MQYKKYPMSKKSVRTESRLSIDISCHWWHWHIASTIDGKATSFKHSSSKQIIKTVDTALTTKYSY